MTRRSLTPAAERYAALGRRLVERFSGELFPYRQDFALPGTAVPGWPAVPCNVKDPQKVRGGLADLLRRREDVADLRILTVDPAWEGQLPAVGSVTRWDGGTLRVENYSQDGTFSGIRQAVCQYVPGAP